MFTGLTSTTAKKLQLDAGALYKNYDPAVDTPATAAAKLIGATQGGSSLSMVPEIRSIEVDGAKGPIKGLQAIDSWTCTLTSNVKEVTVDTIKMALASVTTSTPTAPTNYSLITINGDIADSDYIDNVTWIGKMSNSNDPIMIVMENTLCLNGFNFTVKDKGEGVVPLVLTAHYDAADLDDVPCKIYYPTSQIITS